MKNEFPFLQMDMQKFMQDFKFPGFDADAMKKAFDSFKMPMANGNLPLGVEALMSAHRQNLETLTKANQVIAENFQAIAQRQSEIMRGYMEEVATAVKEVVSAGSPEVSAQHQAAFAKKTMESAIQHMREFAELTSKSGTEVFELVNKQVMSNLDQMKKTGKHEASSKKK